MPSPTATDDGALVGSIDILSSKNVIEPTNAVNQKILTPSQYSDSRGDIHNISVRETELNEKRINILYTKKGAMRSGDIHPNTQCDFVFSGLVEVWTLRKDGTTEKTRYGAKEFVAIPPYVPHIFHFLEDSVIAEFWEDAKTGESSNFRAWFYIPYRSIVDASFTSSSKGDMKVFREAGKRSSSIFCLGVGIVLCACSFVIGRYSSKR